ncbi:CbtA family protein [Streptomyces sp. NPDC056470]|uniref:CbtA family protein n=1 Tax=Streptomyces sp. NPDC056470 TaxID=3345831 RepID=UPI0036B48234
MNSATVGKLLARGMVAGLLAGLLALVVAYFLGEPPTEAGIAYEAALSHEEGAELVSRAAQSTAGLATGILVYGVGLGGIAALAYCFALGRIGAFGPRATAALLSLGGLLAFSVAPFLKYPANPPAVSDPATISQRTTLYLLMVVLSVLLAVSAVILVKRLAPRLGNWNASVAAGAFFVLAVGLAYAFLPAVNEMPKDFPASVVWQFRVSALAIQATLWAGFGLVFGALAERLLEPRESGERIGAMEPGAVAPSS